MTRTDYVPVSEGEMATLMRVMPNGYGLHFGLGGYLNRKSCPEAYRVVLIMREELCPDFLMFAPGVAFNGPQ